MALWGEIAIKVKRAVLLAESFTVSHIAGITGIKYQSVETVIQRLLKEGVIVRVKSERSGSKQGRPKQYYTFANSDKAMVLRNNLDALLMEQSLINTPKDEPANPHYVKACSTINTLETTTDKITEELLNDIEINLRISQEYEEMVDENNKIMIAYNDLARARLELLRDNMEDAAKLFASAKSVFKQYNMQEKERLIDECFLFSQLQKVAKQASVDVQNNHYDVLAEKLKTLSADFGSCTFMPPVAAQIGKLCGAFSQLSSSTSALIIKNRQLEEENKSLYAENEKLAIQHRLTTEINLNLSETIKNLSSSQENYYPQQKLPIPSIADMDKDIRLPENVIDLFERKASKERKVAH